MDELLKLFKRFVEAHEKIADALGEMNADGIAVVITDASAEEGKPEEPAEEETTEEEQPEEETTEEETTEEEAGDDDDLTGTDDEEETGPTQADVRKEVRAYATKHGEPKAIALMKKVAKAGKISEIKEEFYQAVIDACKKK